MAEVYADDPVWVYQRFFCHEYETNRLRRLFSAFECVAELNADLLKNTVSEVLVTRQNVKLRLKNGQVIERSDLQ